MPGTQNPRRKHKFERTPSVVEERVSASFRRVGPKEPVPNEPSGSERRTEHREKKACAGQITVDGQQYQVRLSDLSEHGVCCMPLPYWVKRGAPILLNVDSCQLVGRIAWRRQLSSVDDDVQVGIRFSSGHPDLLKDAYCPPDP